MEEANRPIDAGSIDKAAPEMTDNGEPVETPAPHIDPSLLEEAGALIDNARTYAEAELGFQKTRAAFAGRLVGVAIGLGIVAVVVLHIAFLSLAVGLVLAIEQSLGIWAAIGIVFGGLILVVGLLGWGAFSSIRKLATLFSSSDDKEDKA